MDTAVTETRADHARAARLAPALAVAAFAVPVSAVVILATTHRWYPASDQAIIELRTWDVGSTASPLVGPFSRLGWNHPGPLLFWALAIPYRLLGASSSGLLLSAAIINTS